VRESRSQARRTFSAEHHASLLATTARRSAFAVSLSGPPVLGAAGAAGVAVDAGVHAHVHSLALLLAPAARDAGGVHRRRQRLVGHDYASRVGEFEEAVPGLPVEVDTQGADRLRHRRCSARLGTTMTIRSTRPAPASLRNTMPARNVLPGPACTGRAGLPQTFDQHFERPRLPLPRRWLRGVYRVPRARRQVTATHQRLLLKPRVHLVFLDGYVFGQEETVIRRPRPIDHGGARHLSLALELQELATVVGVSGHRTR
jgi:hypothetical protein